ncbi:PREDICTED: hydroxysteroid dehydrogenase-like protein 2 isoform X2 [Nicrophorus vespilloides]|uniref:Hydroxysteroid dehydrogenase-like protein 2 n=1 Tax=Nicrophorus vespilloides TaxID=110193 RepID=A0ABM1MJ66_NICVS|nr:PREDICTED: hydroxysteroid dehydrogenase-like protein 2 isoform X2 [Nicrophorus vespilloides]
MLKKLSGLTVFVTGGSRGIGKAIALKAAKDGANVVVAAKTATANPKLPGTIYTACDEIEAAGGKALPCIVDVRDEKQVRSAVEEAIKKFGGIDILINNASAIQLSPTDQTDMKRYDLMHNINTRGTFLTTKECLPYLKKSKHAHILNLSPPLNMNPLWFQNHVAYTMAKYGMSMCVLGMHAEFKPFNIGVNALWPRTGISTAAIEMLAGDESFKYTRKPEIMADAAYVILSQDPRKVTGNFFIDEQILKEHGVTDFDQYANDPSQRENMMIDFFLDEALNKQAEPTKKTEESIKPAGEVGKIFVAIEKNLSEDLVKSTNAVFAFNLTGKESGKWFVDLKNGTGKCGQGDAPSGADATLTMDSKNFFDMFTGKTKPTTAYMMGKLKIAGNMQKAMKLEKLMGKLKSKL